MRRAKRRHRPAWQGQRRPRSPQRPECQPRMRPVLRGPQLGRACGCRRRGQSLPSADSQPSRDPWCRYPEERSSVWFPCLTCSLHWLHAHRSRYGLFPRDHVAQLAAEVVKLDFRYVAGLETNAFSKREAVRTHEVDVQGAGLAVKGEFEMVVLEIRQAVTHVVLAGGDLFLPQHVVAAEDAHRTRNVVEHGIDHELRADAAHAQLRSGKVEVVAALEDMIGELIARRHPDSPWAAILRNQVNGCDLG